MEGITGPRDGLGLGGLPQIGLPGRDAELWRWRSGLLGREEDPCWRFPNDPGPRFVGAVDGLVAHTLCAFTGPELLFRKAFIPILELGRCLFATGIRPPATPNRPETRPKAFCFISGWPTFTLFIAPLIEGLCPLCGLACNRLLPLSSLATRIGLSPRLFNKIGLSPLLLRRIGLSPRLFRRIGLSPRLLRKSDALLEVRSTFGEASLRRGRLLLPASTILFLIELLRMGRKMSLFFDRLWESDGSRSPSLESARRCRPPPADWSPRDGHPVVPERTMRVLLVVAQQAGIVVAGPL